MKLVVRPWNCFSRFAYITLLFFCLPPSTIETCLSSTWKWTPKIGRGDSLLGRPWVFFKVPVTSSRSISGCGNYFGITGFTYWWTTSRGYSFMFEQLRVSDRFGISDVSTLKWSFFLGILGHLPFCLRCVLSFFGRFFLNLLISPIWNPIAFGVVLFLPIHILWSFLHFW